MSNFEGDLCGAQIRARQWLAVLRPSISCARLASDCVRGSTSATTLPARITTQRVARLRTSCSLWLMKTMLTPPLSEFVVASQTIYRPPAA